MKPDYIEVIKKAEFMEVVEKDMAEARNAISSEEEHLAENHAHNHGVAHRLAELYSFYAHKIQSYIQVRSAIEESYVFLRDTRTGNFGFKHVRAPWEGFKSYQQGESAPGGPAPRLGPSATEGQYL